MMNSSLKNMIEENFAPHSPYNVPGRSTLWSLTGAVAEVTSLWKSTCGSLDTARDSLYNFLGATYEHAYHVDADKGAKLKLRNQVREQFPTKRQAAYADRATSEALLLVAALGVQRGSLRSKYKALLARAAVENVARDRNSFTEWLRSNGGIVKALREAVSTLSPEKQPTSSSGTSSSDALIRAQLATKSVCGMERISLVGNKPPSDTFHVVIYRSDGTALVPCFESDDRTVVSRLLRLVAPRLAVPAPEQSAKPATGNKDAMANAHNRKAA